MDTCHWQPYLQPSKAQDISAPDLGSEDGDKHRMEISTCMVRGAADAHVLPTLHNIAVQLRYQFTPSDMFE